MSWYQNGLPAIVWTVVRGGKTISPTGVGPQLEKALTTPLADTPVKDARVWLLTSRTDCQLISPAHDNKVEVRTTDAGLSS